MGKQKKNCKTMQVRPATHVEIEFKVTIKEIHSRTLKNCDQSLATFSFSLDHDFELAAAWLKTDTAELVFDDLCGEIGHYLDVESGGER